MLQERENSSFLFPLLASALLHPSPVALPQLPTGSSQPAWPCSGETPQHPLWEPSWGRGNCQRCGAIPCSCSHPGAPSSHPHRDSARRTPGEFVKPRMVWLPLSHSPAVTLPVQHWVPLEGEAAPHGTRTAAHQLKQGKQMLKS